MKPAPMTDEQIDGLYIDGIRIWLGKARIARAIEAARDQQWAEMLENQEPVAWMDRDGDVYKSLPTPNWHPPHTPLFTTPPDHTAAMRQALALVAALADDSNFDHGGRFQRWDEFAPLESLIAALKQALGDAA